MKTKEQTAIDIYKEFNRFAAEQTVKLSDALTDWEDFLDTVQGDMNPEDQKFSNAVSQFIAQLGLAGIGTHASVQSLLASQTTPERFGAESVPEAPGTEQPLGTALHRAGFEPEAVSSRP